MGKELIRTARGGIIDLPPALKDGRKNTKKLAGMSVKKPHPKAATQSARRAGNAKKAALKATDHAERQWSKSVKRSTERMQTAAARLVRAGRRGGEAKTVGKFLMQVATHAKGAIGNNPEKRTREAIEAQLGILDETDALNLAALDFKQIGTELTNEGAYTANEIDSAVKILKDAVTRRVELIPVSSPLKRVPMSADPS